MSGWYKQQRNLSERAWFKDACMVQLYHYLKERAYVTEGRYEGIIIRRGSCPITRSEIMEATGIKYMKLDRTLKKLVSYGEIIIKANNHFSIITICDYDNYTISQSLFDTTNEITDDTADEITNETTHLLTIEERYKENLITPLSRYKNERERQDVVLEIKKRYNKRFDGKLPPLLRLTLPTRMMVEECLRRYGMQSVDMVFSQVEHEPFSLGKNNTGFIANFQYIFEPRNFQQYLERAQLRKRKELSTKKVNSSADITAHLAEEKQGRREYLMSWVEAEAVNPTKRGQELLRSCQKSGELDDLGIKWKEQEI